MHKKNKLICFLLIGTFFLIHIQAIGQSTLDDDYINITVEEAWEFLSDTSNGIQIAIDVRTDIEWQTVRIDTPYPEFPRHFVLDKIQDEEEYQIFLSLYDGNDVILNCKAGSRSATAATILIDRGFNGTVYNVVGGITDWQNKDYPVKRGNDLPNIPATPTGPTVCSIGESYSFSSSSQDINEDIIRLGFDWNGDMHVDEFSEYMLPNTEISLSHIWNMAETYELRVLAEDHVGGQSSFSEPLEILINNPPTKPQVVGPKQGKSGEEYSYLLSSRDMDNDTVLFFVDWGDGMNSGWIGPFASDEEVNVSHSWVNSDTYEMKIKAKDIYDAESDVTILEVAMPKSRNIFHILEQICSYLIPWKTIFSFFPLLHIK